jgi:hypothetical protein
MRTVNYIDVLRTTARLCGLDVDPLTSDTQQNLDPAEFRALRDFHSNRLNTAAEFQRWPELELTEKRWFRAKYAALTAYTAATEVFFPATNQYYQSLRSTTGNDPANSDGETNESYWAECAVSYSAEDYDSTKTYVQGEQAYFPETDRYYQLFAATSTGNDPDDDTKWGVLTEFDRYVSYAQTGFTAMGQVFEVWDANPKPNFQASELNWSLSANGVQVMEEVPYVWIVFRIRIPELTGDAYDATATYAVGKQIYFESASTPGNFYTRITDTSAAGESPDSDAASWTLVEIPLLFDRYLKHAGAGDWMTSDQRLEEAAAQYALGEAAIGAQGLLLTGQQGQNQRTNVLTR